MEPLLLLLAIVPLALALPVESAQSLQSSSPVNEASTSLQFAIRSYSDPGSKTPDGGVCRCPESGSCKEEDQCSFTFTFIVFTPNQKTDVYETSEFRLGTNGQLPMNQKSGWGKEFMATTNGKPSSLDILVHHHGPTYDDKGKLKSGHKLILVDRFHIDLNTVRPSGVQNMQSNEYQGQILNSRLSLAMSLTCSGDLLGPDCDLKCNRSTVNSNVAVCSSERHYGLLAVCDWASGKTAQVENCQKCPWGIVEDSYCREEAGGVANTTRTGCVSVGYRTATFALLTLFLLAALAGIAAFFCCKYRKSNKAPEASEKAANSEGTAASPLLRQNGSRSDIVPDAPDEPNMQKIRGVQTLAGVSVSAIQKGEAWVKDDKELFEYKIRVENNSGHKIRNIVFAHNTSIKQVWDAKEVDDRTLKTTWIEIENGASCESPGYICYGPSRPTILEYKIIGGEVVTAA